MRKKKLIPSTYLRYALSYFVIIAILLLGFTFILRKQINQRFITQNTLKLQTGLNNTSQWMEDNYIHLRLISDSLAESIIKATASYSRIPSREYYISQELDKYDACSQLISGIIYKSHQLSDVLHSKSPATYENGIFYIGDPYKPDKTITFDPAPFYNAGDGQFFYLSNGKTGYFIYFPDTSKYKKDLFFFVLDTQLIKDQLTNLISDQVTALALFDENKQAITGVNTAQLIPYMDDFLLAEGTYKHDSSTSIQVYDGIPGGLSLVCLLSNDFLNSQVNEAFANSYVSLLLLSMIGFFLVLFAMRITYTPLHRLTQKIAPECSPRSSHLDLLESTFYKSIEEKKLLQDKLEYYRISMQKSLLNSLVLSKCPDTTIPESSIDQFFDAEPSKLIFVLKLSNQGKHLPYLQLLPYIREHLSIDSSCLLLETQIDCAVFLINYTGKEPHKEQVLLELLWQLHREHGYLSAISNGSPSPLDIPSLYETVIQASKCWHQTPVADVQSLPSAASSSYAYPHDKLEQLSSHLRNHHFEQAQNIVEELFQTIDEFILSRHDIPDFFLHCILIDMLTIIINSINQCGIKFKSYSDLYSATLYYCRSCTYAEKAPEILENMHALISFFALEVSNSTFDFTQILHKTQLSYSDPNFSISLLADLFETTIANMSYLFKKNLDQTFSDYLWELRLEKAQELLENSELSIDEISVAVGYLNTSSFRRKFKQKTGLTPAQYRNERK